jgi:iron(III) transport system substrate-binding protein
VVKYMSEGRRIRHIVSIGALAIATTWALSACAPGAGGEVAARAGDLPWTGLEGRERESALLEPAKSEGTLMVYSAFNDEQSMADAFAEKYGLKVEVYTGNSESVLQRASKEVSAGQISNDVLILPAIDMEAVNDDGILSVYESEYRDAVSDKGKGEDWTGVRRLAFVAGWNTENLDTGDVPTDYADLADPAWKGRLSMEMSDFDWYATLADDYRDSGMSDSEVAALFEGLVANSEVTKGHTAQGDFLAAGKYDIALSLYSQTVERSQGNGAPVSYGDGSPRVEPVVVRYDAGALMAGTDNPAAATLYLDFQLSQPGFEVDRSLGALPPVADSADPIAGAELLEQDVPDLVERRKDLDQEYNDLITR